ncbi:adenylyltransferase/cytidyltransferase family protein [Patescibacteria group bacterium]|nr:adenylyltransferase/cytidyltransferase family protein [Patescibacteria group bacterium]
MSPTTVLVFGVFDLLHAGHLYFLRQAKKFGSKLYVVVTRDNLTKQLKNQSTWQNQTKRLANLNKLPFVSQAVLGNKTVRHNYQMIKLIKPTVVCLGYDQKIPINLLKKQLAVLGLNPKIIRLKPYQPKKYKSSLLKKNSKLSAIK